MNKFINIHGAIDVLHVLYKNKFYLKPLVFAQSTKQERRSTACVCNNYKLLFSLGVADISMRQARSAQSKAGKWRVNRYLAASQWSNSFAVSYPGLSNNFYIIFSYYYDHQNFFYANSRKRS